MIKIVAKGAFWASLKRRALLFAAIVAVSAFGRLQAGNFYFTGEGDGHSWNLRDNWRSGSETGTHTLPSYGDTVIINPGEGQSLFLSTSNTTESSTWPCHRVYKFMSGTTYIDRAKAFYFHGGADTDPQIYVAPGATVVLSNSVSAYNSGPLRKTGAGTFIQIGVPGKTASAPTGKNFDVQEGSWLLKSPRDGYGAYCQNANLFVRNGATLLVQGFNSMSDSVKATVEEGGNLVLNGKGGEVKIATLLGAGTVMQDPEASALETTNFKLTFDKGACEFTGIISNVTQVLFAPSDAALEAGNFVFNAAGDTFRFAPKVVGGGDAIHWVSGVTEAAFGTYQSSNGSVLRTENVDGDPVNLSIANLTDADTTTLRVTGGGDLDLPGGRTTVFKTNALAGFTGRLTYGSTAYNLTFGDGADAANDVDLSQVAAIESRAATTAFRNVGPTSVRRLSGSGAVSVTNALTVGTVDKDGGTLNLTGGFTMSNGVWKTPEIALKSRSAVFTMEDGFVYGGMGTDTANAASVLKVPDKVSFNANDQAGTVRIKGGELVFTSQNNSGYGGVHRLEVLGGRVVQGQMSPTSFATAGNPTTVLIDGGAYLGRSTCVGSDNYRYSSTLFNASENFRVYVGAKGAVLGCGYGKHDSDAGMYYASSLCTAPDLETAGPITLLPQWVSYKFAAPILANGPVNVLGGVFYPTASALVQASPDYFGTGTLTLNSTLLQIGNFDATATLKLAGGVGSRLIYCNASSICLRKEAAKAAQQVVIGNAGAAANSVLARARKGSVLTLWDASLHLGEDGYSSVKVNGGVPVDGASGLVKEPVFISNGTAEYFATYDSEKGFVQLTDTVADLNGGGDSVAVVGGTSLAANATREVAALKVNAWGTLTLNSGSVLRIGNGTDPAKIILQNSTINGSGTIDFGTSEGVVMGGAHPNPNTISAKIAGSGGVTYAATPNYAYRYFNIGGDNAYSGGTWINVARVNVRSATAFGTGDVWVCGDERNGGRVRFDRPATIANDFHLSGWGARQEEWSDRAYANGYGTGNAELGALVFPTNGITLTGNVELIGETRIGATKGVTGVSAELTGVISGGAVEAYGIDGRVLFANDNSYTGGTKIVNGRLNVTRSGSLGTGPVTLDNGTLVFENDAPLTFTNAISGVGSFCLAGSGAVTFATDLSSTVLGPLDLTPGTHTFLGTIPFSEVTNTTGGKSTIEFAENLGLVKWGGVTIDYDRMLLTVKSGTTLDLEGATIGVWRLVAEEGAAVINGTVNESHPKRGLVFIVK